MRVAVNTRFLLPGKLEGIGYFTREIVRRLPDHLPEAAFLFCSDRKTTPALAAHPRVETRVVYPPARHPWLWTLWFNYALPRAAASWGADVLLHLDGYCSLRTSIPQVMVIHDIAHVHYPAEIPGRALRYYERNIPRFLRRAERVLTVSEYVREDIVREYGIAADKLSVTHNGVRPQFGPLPESVRREVRERYASGQQYFFYLGAIHPRKNVARLIRAYTAYRAAGGPAVKLLLGGRLAWQTGEIERARRASDYRDDIHFLGYVDEAELPRLLGSALALVYPSLNEGFGVPLLEAMHAEVPIVTSDRSSLPEVAGQAALFVNPEDIQDLAEALRRVAVDTALTDRLVAAGRERRARYDWDSAAATVAAAVRGLGA